MTTFKDYPIRLVDVSQYQDDPQTVKKPSIEAVVREGFLGIGIRTSYGIVTDYAFQNFWSESKGQLARLGYHYGDYYSHRAKKIDDATWGIMQGGYWWNLLKADPGELPSHLDCEPCGLGGNFTIFNAPSVTKIWRNILTEYDRLSGGFAGIYTAPGDLWMFGDWFKDRDLWLSWYNKNVTYAQIIATVKYYGWRGKVRLWQYASDGDVNNDGLPDGIAMGMETANLDLSVFMGPDGVGSMSEWSAYAGTTPPPVTPPTGDGSGSVVTPPAPTPGAVYKQVQILTINCPSGLNIRNAAAIPSTVIGWVVDKKPIEILETIANGPDLWARVGQDQFCAIRYNGIAYLV